MSQGIVVHLTVQNIITAAALIAAVMAICAAAVKLVKWLASPRKNEEEIKTLKEKERVDVDELRKEQTDAIFALQSEQCLLTFGVLACLKGLQEQGCNGPVTVAIDKIEKHINKAAHGQFTVQKEDIA